MIYPCLLHGVFFHSQNSYSKSLTADTGKMIGITQIRGRKSKIYGQAIQKINAFFLKKTGRLFYKTEIRYNRGSSSNKEQNVQECDAIWLNGYSVARPKNYF